MGRERSSLLQDLQWGEEFTTSWTLLDLEQEKSLPVIENFRTNGIVSISSVPRERTTEDELTDNQACRQIGNQLGYKAVVPKIQYKPLVTTQSSLIKAAETFLTA